MGKNKLSLNDLITNFNSYPPFIPGEKTEEEQVAYAANALNIKNRREQAGKKLTEYVLSITKDRLEANMPRDLYLREQQMMALFEAYQAGNMYGNGLIKIDERNDRMDIMKYVLSKDSRCKSEDPILVSQDDITAVAWVSLASKKLVEQARKGMQVEGVSRWDERIGIVPKLKSANTLVAMGNVIREDAGIKGASLSSVLPKDVIDIVVRGIVAEKVNDIKSFGELAGKQKTGVLSKIQGIFAKVFGRDDRNNDFQK